MALSTQELDDIIKRNNLQPIAPKPSGGLRGAELLSSLEGVQEQPEQKRGFLEKASDVSEKFLEFGAETFIRPPARALLRPFVEATKSIQALIPGGKTGKETVRTPFGDIKPRQLGDKPSETLKESGLETLDLALLGLPVEKLAAVPLKALSRKLFGSALKAKNIIKGGKVVTKAEDLIKTGIDEGIVVASNAIDKVGGRIDDLSRVIDEAIEQGKASGQKIKTAPLKEFMGDLREFFSNQVDVEGSVQAVKEIDSLVKNFITKHGDEIPVEVAQQIKKNTNSILSKSFDKLTTASNEGQKQINRFLKEGIVDKVEVVGGINKRIKNLIDFEKAVQKAGGRISSANLLGLGSKIGGATGGVPGAIAGKLLELVDSPTIKSSAAIGLDRLAGKGGKAFKNIKIPLVGLINNLVSFIREEESKR